MKVVIADTDSLVQCSNSQLGEIWIASPFTAQGYYVVHGGDANMSYKDHFQVRKLILCNDGTLTCLFVEEIWNYSLPDF